MRNFKILVFFLSLYASGNSFATLVATNSPVKSREAVFRYTAKKDFSPTAVEFAFYTESGAPYKTPLKWISGTILKEQDAFIIKVRVSELKPGKYKSHVKLKESDSNGNQKVEKVEFQVDQSLEVSEPGKEGLETLAGVDTDEDGIRDDVQRHINESYNLSIYPSTNRALKNMYRYFQQAIINFRNESEASKHYTKYREANGCLMWIVGTGHSTIVREEISSTFLNTSDRLKASYQIYSYFHGKDRPATMNISPLQYNKLCEFEAKEETP
jgi:hypothetical protein